MHFESILKLKTQDKIQLAVIVVCCKIILRHLIRGGDVFPLSPLWVHLCNILPLSKVYLKEFGLSLCIWSSFRCSATMRYNSVQTKTLLISIQFSIKTYPNVKGALLYTDSSWALTTSSGVSSAAEKRCLIPLSFRAENIECRIAMETRRQVIVEFHNEFHQINSNDFVAIKTKKIQDVGREYLTQKFTLRIDCEPKLHAEPVKISFCGL